MIPQKPPLLLRKTCQIPRLPTRESSGHKAKPRMSSFIVYLLFHNHTDLSDILAPAQKLKAALRSAAGGGWGAGLPYHLEHLECIQSHSLGPRAQGSDS